MTIVEKQFLRKFNISSWPKPRSKAVRISSQVYFRNQRVVYLWHKICTHVNKYKTKQNTFYTLKLKETEIEFNDSRNWSVHLILLNVRLNRSHR